MPSPPGTPPHFTPSQSARGDPGGGAFSPVGGDLTEAELRGLKAPVLVELVLASREQKNSLEKRCSHLAGALHQAQSSLETLERQSYIVQVH